MAVLGKVGKTISTKGKEAAHRAKDVAELAKLSAQVSQLEGKLKAYYQIIGEKVYLKEKDQEHTELEAEFDLINSTVAEIAGIKKQISDIRGTRQCAECRAEVDNSFAFCPHCGTKFEEPAAEPEDVEEPEEGCCCEEDGCDCGENGPKAGDCGCEGNEPKAGSCGCEENGAEAGSCGCEGNGPEAARCGCEGNEPETACGCEDNKPKKEWL